MIDNILLAAQLADAPPSGAALGLTAAAALAMFGRGAMRRPPATTPAILWLALCTRSRTAPPRSLDPEAWWSQTAHWRGVWINALLARAADGDATALAELDRIMPAVDAASDARDRETAALADDHADARYDDEGEAAYGRPD